jgi:hypothetical protein
MALYNERVFLELGPTADASGNVSWRRAVPGPTGAQYQVVSATLMPDANITANATNFATFTLTNTTTSTTMATRAYSSGSSTGGTAEPLTVATAGQIVSAGDVLTWQKADSGTGLACRPRVVVELQRIK